MASPAPESDFRPDINALRALAVLSVIAYHFDMLGAKSGYIGVDVFFVISGFLIGGQVGNQIERGAFSLRAFMVSRIRRIVPALVTVCVAVYLWGWLYLLPGDYRLLVRNVISVLFFVSNIAFAGQQGYFDLGAMYKPLLHTWSLSVEAQFYLLLPFLLMFAFRLSPRLRATATLGLASLSFVAALVMGARNPDAVFFAFAARAWEFLVGCLIAWHSRDILAKLVMPGFLHKALLASAWAALIAACFLIPRGMMWPGLWTLAPVLLTAAIIVLRANKPHGVLVRNPALQHVGSISYSLYLWHWPLLVCWGLTSGQATAAHGPILWALLAGTWVLAWLSWRFVEQPFRVNRAYWTSPRVYWAYASALVLCVTVGTFIWTQNGLPSRLPDYVQGAQLATRFRPRLDEHCWKLPRAGEKKDALYACDLGNPKSVVPSVALWGDSHSLQFLEPLQSAVDGGAMSGYLFHRPGCEPSFPAPGSTDPCDIHNEEVLRQITGTPSIRTLVIAIRHNDPRRVDRTMEAARRMLDKNYRVVFLGPLPEARRAVAQEWATVQLLRRQPVMEMTLERDATTGVQSFNQRLAHWRQSAAVLQLAYPGSFVALDVTDRFCDASRCWLVRDGKGLFGDADHLTPIGAAEVLPALLSALNAARS
jgi:peptidoglycan/LPS O-acetylase OafA/YrhL